MANSAEQAAFSGSKHSCLSGVGMAVGSSFWGSSSLSSDEGLSVGTGGVAGSFSATFNMVMLNRLPLLSRGARLLQSSWIALHSITGGIPHCMVYHWKAWVSATILSHHTIWTTRVPRNLVDGGRKSFHLNTPRQSGVLHQLLFSSWARGILKAAACWLAIS